MKKRNRKRKLTRSQKGISLIALTTTILVLAIVTSIVVYNAKNNIMIKQYKKLENDIDVLNNKVGMYYLKNGELPICMRSDRTYIEYNDNRTGKEQKYNKFKEDKHQNDNDKYFILDLNKIDGISLNYGADFYKIDQAYKNLAYCPDLDVTNQQSHRIYYVKGIDMGIERAADGSLSNGKVYYTVGENVEIPLYKSIKYIKDLTDLKEVRKNVNEGSQTYKDWILIQTQNIKMNGEEWNEPIGTDAHPFEGEYNGAGYAIENFKINSTVSGGIFGVNKGTIQNLGIESGKIVANGISGAIVSKNAGGSIINCYNKADAVYNITNIESGASAGICGQSTGGIISQCYNSGTITANFSKRFSAVCGIVGVASNTRIEECYNIGNISGIAQYSLSKNKWIDGNNRACGIADEIDTQSKIINCYNMGNITLTTKIAEDVCPVAAGILGQNQGGNVENCYNAGNITVNETRTDIKTTRRAAICGCNYLNGNESNYINCYYVSETTVNSLTAVGSNGYDGKNGYAPIVGNAKKPSELRNLASVLGDAYKEDKNSSLNSGYPILTWQQ